jgi:hypothetical protein
MGRGTWNASARRAEKKLSRQQNSRLAIFITIVVALLAALLSRSAFSSNSDDAAAKKAVRNNNNNNNDNNDNNNDDTNDDNNTPHWRRARERVASVVDLHSLFAHPRDAAAFSEARARGDRLRRMLDWLHAEDVYFHLRPGVVLRHARWTAEEEAVAAAAAVAAAHPKQQDLWADGSTVVSTSGVDADDDDDDARDIVDDATAAGVFVHVGVVEHESKPLFRMSSRCMVGGAPRALVCPFISVSFSLVEVSICAVQFVSLCERTTLDDRIH